MRKVHIEIKQLIFVGKSSVIVTDESQKFQYKKLHIFSWIHATLLLYHNI